MLVIRPKFDAWTLFCGVPKLGWLKTLKASQRTGVKALTDGPFFERAQVGDHRLHISYNGKRLSVQEPVSECFMITAIHKIRESLLVSRSHTTGAPHFVHGMQALGGADAVSSDDEHIATLPAIFPEWLGDSSFCSIHRVRFPYVVGEMAHGISTAAMVIEASRCGMLGFLGCAGMQLDAMEAALEAIKAGLAENTGWGANLIHSLHDSEREMQTVDLFLRRRVERVSASAFMKLTPAIIRYALSGLRLSASGEILRKHRVLAKVSRAETAIHFLLPAPAEMVSALREQGYLTDEEARLAQWIPISEDITVEADSGGHTDNRPLTVLLPMVMQLRDEIAERHGFRGTIRVGAAGGLGEPSAVAAAFCMGAAYVVTGSINQAAVEAGTSHEVKQLLAQADVTDVMMAPSADMFEPGVKVQVLRRGTMFAMRARMLYEVYRENNSLEDIAPDVRATLERDLFRASFDELWQQTRRFWSEQNADEVHCAEQDPKHKMALCFRAYLGQAAGWARHGDLARKLDYQIWCGPSMGAFNRWVKGSFLEPLDNRTVSQIGLNLLEGAAVITRAQQLRMMGVDVPTQAFDFRPRFLR